MTWGEKSLSACLSLLLDMTKMSNSRSPTCLQLETGGPECKAGLPRRREASRSLFLHLRSSHSCSEVHLRGGEFESRCSRKATLQAQKGRGGWGSWCLAKGSCVVRTHRSGGRPRTKRKYRPFIKENCAFQGSSRKQYSKLGAL